MEREEISNLISPFRKGGGGDLRFKQRVLSIVAAIPRGKVMTYQQVAAKAGNVRAARVVGNLMKSNFDPKVPCHRVIRTDGKIGDYNRGGPKEKARKLKEEGYLK